MVIVKPAEKDQQLKTSKTEAIVGNIDTTNQNKTHKQKNEINRRKPPKKTSNKITKPNQNKPTNPQTNKHKQKYTKGERTSTDRHQ